MNKKDLSKKAKEAELIIWYQDYAGKFLPQRYLKYKNLFIQKYSEFYTDNNSVFEIFIKDFKEQCEQIEKSYGLSRLDAMEDNVKKTEKTFLNLVREVHTFTRRRKEIYWSVEEIADSVLCHMSEYEKNNHPVGMTIEEDMLDCLLFID